MSIGKNEALS